MLLSFGLTPDALHAAVGAARAHDLATIGELGETSYYEAQDEGVDAFVHTSRYSLELAPADLRAQAAAAPFGPRRRALYELYTRLRPDDAALLRHAQRLAAKRTLLMPTLALLYLELPGHQNRWKEPVAKILDPADIHLPADRETGAPTAPGDVVAEAFPPGIAAAELIMEEAYRRAGARYLTLILDGQVVDRERLLAH